MKKCSVHQVKWETIDKFPKSRLQKLRYATTQCKYNDISVEITSNILRMTFKKMNQLFRLT